MSLLSINWYLYSRYLLLFVNETLQHYVCLMSLQWVQLPTSPLPLPGSWLSGDAVLVFPSEKLTTLHCLPTNELTCMEDDKAKSNHSPVPKHVSGLFASIFGRLQKNVHPRYEIRILSFLIMAFPLPLDWRDCSFPRPVLAQTLPFLLYRLTTLFFSFYICLTVFPFTTTKFNVVL